MMFALYSFNPSTLLVDGYVYIGRYESEQECDEAATGFDYYRIELISDFGACLKFESPWEAI